MKPSSTLNTFSLFILLNPTEPYLLLTLEAHLGKIFHRALVVGTSLAYAVLNNCPM